MGKAEKAVEDKLCNGIRRLGGRAYKFVSPGRSGVPDRIVCLPTGVTIFVELKKADGRLSKQQQARIAELEKMKQSVFVIYGCSEVAKFLEYAKGLTSNAIYTT